MDKESLVEIFIDIDEGADIDRLISNTTDTMELTFSNFLDQFKPIAHLFKPR